MPIVQTGSIHLHYLERGAGETAVVFLHAALASGRQWLSVLDHLSPRLRAIAPDLRGHGRSDKPEQDNDNGAMAADVAELLDRLGLERAYLVGLSMGGSVALRFAVQYPERVLGLVIVGSNAANPITRRASPAWLERARRAYEDEHALRRFVASVYAIPPSEEMLQEDMEDARRASYQVWFARRIGPPPPELLDGLSRLHAPALVIQGDRDRVASLEAAQRLHDLLPNSQLVVWREHGHFLPQENPTRFADLLNNFVRQNGAGHQAPFAEQ